MVYDLTKIDIPMDECSYEDEVLRTLWKQGFVNALNGVQRANVFLPDSQYYMACHEGWKVGNRTSWDELGLEPQINEAGRSELAKSESKGLLDDLIKVKFLREKED